MVSLCKWVIPSTTCSMGDEDGDVKSALNSYGFLDDQDDDSDDDDDDDDDDDESGGWVQTVCVCVYVLRAYENWL